MTPHEPPPLQPSDSDPVFPAFGTIPRAQRRTRIAAATLAVLFSATVAGVAGLLLSSGSQTVVVANAWRHLAAAPNVQLDGSLVRHHDAAARGPDVAFEASKQPQGVYMNAILRTGHGGEPTDTPVEMFITDQTSYLNVHGAEFFDGLIRNANPAGALQILRTQAVFSSQLQDRWVQLKSSEIVALHQRPAAQSVRLLPTQQCVAAMLGGGAQSRQRVLRDVGDMLARQEITNIGGENNDTSSLHYRIVMTPDEVKRARESVPDSPGLQRFSECLGAQADRSAPGLVVDMWVDAENHHFTRVQFALRSEDARLATFQSDITYDVPVARQIPTDALTLAEIEAQAAANQAAIDTAFQRHLASFPSLNALVRELQALEVGQD